MKLFTNLAIFSFILTLTANFAFAQTKNTSVEHYRTGKQKYQQKKFQEAIQSFNKCLALRTSATGCKHSRGLAYLQLKEFDKAIADFSDLLKLPYLNTQNKIITLNDRVTAYCYSGQVTKATADENTIKSLGGNIKITCVEFLKQNSGSSNQNKTSNNKKLAESYYKKGNDYRNKCQYQEAFAAYTNAIKYNPNDGDYYGARADVLLYLDKTKVRTDLNKAISLWRLEKKPSSSGSISESLKWDTNVRRRNLLVNGINNSMRFLRASGKNSLAPSCKSQSNNKNQNKTPAKTKQDADKLKQSGLFGDELPSLGKIPAVRKTVSAADRAKAEEYYRSGLAKYKKSQCGAAIADFTKSINLNPYNAEAYIRRGFCFGILKNKTKQLDDYNQAIIVDPNNSTAYNNRGLFYTNQKDWNKAIADLKKAIKLKPTNITARLNLAYTYEQMGDYDKSIAAYKTCLQADPNYKLCQSWMKRAIKNQKNVKSPQAKLPPKKSRKQTPKSKKTDLGLLSTGVPNSFLSYGELIKRGDRQYAARKYKAAFDSYTAAIKLRPKSANAHNRRGLALKSLGKYREAIVEYSKSIEISPTNTVAFYNRANAYKTLRNYRQSIADFSKVISLRNNDAQAIEERSRVYCLNKQFALAKADEQKAKQLGEKIDFPCSPRPKPRPVPTNRTAVTKKSSVRTITTKAAERWMKTGVQQLFDKKFQMAVESFSKTIALDPKADNAYAQRAFAHGLLGNESKGLADANKALSLNPRNIRARSLRGTFTRVSNPRAAIEDFTFVINNKPDAEAYSNRGEVYTLLNQDNLAIRDFNKSISLDPKKADTFFKRGMSYIRLNNIVKAEVDANMSLKLDPGNADGLFLRGRVLFGKGQYIPAIGSLSRSIVKNPNKAATYHLRGIAYCAVGSIKRATEDEQKATSLGLQTPEPCAKRSRK